MPVYAQIFVKSVWYALLTTLFCLLIAYPLSLLIARSAEALSRSAAVARHSSVLEQLPHPRLRVDDHPRARTPRWRGRVNSVLALVRARARPAAVQPFAVLVCLVYVHLPFMVLPLYANLEKHDQALLDAAQDLGANAWQRFWRVTFPLSLPGVYAGAALVFIPALGIFAIPDILGGPEDSLIGNVIKQQFLETRDWPFGSVLSIVLTVAALLLAGLAAWVGRRNLGARQATCVSAPSRCGRLRSRATRSCTFR